MVALISLESAINLHVVILGSYLSTIETSVLDLGYDIPLPCDVDPLGVRLVDGVAGSRKDIDERLHLGGLDL